MCNGSQGLTSVRYVCWLSRQWKETEPVLLAVPVPKKVSWSFPCPIAGERHMGRAAGRAGFTLNCERFVPLSQNSCWSLSILLPVALRNPRLHLFSTGINMFPPTLSTERCICTSPYFFSPPLRFPPLFPSVTVLWSFHHLPHRTVLHFQCAALHLASYTVLFGLLCPGRKHFHSQTWF